MLTYQIRKRVFKVDGDSVLAFPAPVKATFVLQPLQPFGMAPGGGKTATRAVKASAKFDANTGRHWIESEKPLEPLDVVIDEPGRHVEIKGNELRISIPECESFDELSEIFESLYYGYDLPPFLGPRIMRV
ncbi:MAG: hypothetical protein IIC82_05040 [Chloroflexi bacterium]|nr:hypothetical protein [Chloroflexota bacterium]